MVDATSFNHGLCPRRQPQRTIAKKEQTKTNGLSQPYLGDVVATSANINPIGRLRHASGPHRTTVALPIFGQQDTPHVNEQIRDADSIMNELGRESRVLGHSSFVPGGKPASGSRLHCVVRFRTSLSSWHTTSQVLTNSSKG